MKRGIISVQPRLPLWDHTSAGYDLRLGEDSLLGQAGIINIL